MRDPERLIDGGSRGLERLMLEAGRGENPSPELQLSMARGLGLSGTGLPVAPAPAAIPAAAATSAVAGSTVWISAGIVAAVVAAVVGIRAVWSPRSIGQPPAVFAPASPIAQTQAAATTRPSRGGDGDEIADEIRLLDGARAALQARRSERALEQLATYARRHPRGTLQPEAMVLHIEALQQDGRRADAVALSRRFLTTYPDSPLVERVERVSGLHRR